MADADKQPIAQTEYPPAVDLPPAYGSPVNQFGSQSAPVERAVYQGDSMLMVQQPPESIIVNQPVPQQHAIIQQQHHHVIQLQQGRDWSSHLCGCCTDCGTCALVFFFPPCYNCYLATKMDENCCVGWCVPNNLNILRTKLRTQENIRGDICNDCMVTHCCYMCAMCQMSREVDYIKQRPNAIHIQTGM